MQAARDVGPAFSADGAGIGLYASWGARFGAWLIDWVLIYAALIALTMAVTSGGQHDARPVWSVLYVLTIVFGPPLYFMLCHGSEAGQTVGKRICGIAVHDANSFGRLSYPRALWRWLATFLLWVPFVVPGLIDGFSPLWSDASRAWHDRAAGSVVVRV